MIKKAIQIMRGIPDQFRRYCDDFKDRKGCGQELKIFTDAKGKKQAYDPEPVPCRTQSGEVVWAFVPHWATCPHQKDYYHKFQQEKAESREKYIKENPREQAPELRRA